MEILEMELYQKPSIVLVQIECETPVALTGSAEGVQDEQGDF